MKKTIIIFYFLSILTFANNSFTIHVGSCNLKIPNRYKLETFSPPYRFDFTHLENENIEKFKRLNFLLTHKIAIVYNKKNYKEKDIIALVNSLKKGNTIYHKKYSNLELFHFKPLLTPKTENEKLFITTNSFLIFGKNFSIYVDETDKYVDEIYTMIEDCKE